MTTPNEYAKDATAALHHVLHISPADFDAEGATAVIEQAIRNATRERESRTRRQLSEVQGCGAGASGAIAEFVTCGDLQLQGDRRFCAHFRQRQYQSTCSAMHQRSIWRTRPSGATGSIPTTSPASRTPYPNSSRTGSNAWSIAFAARTAPIAG